MRTASIAAVTAASGISNPVANSRGGWRAWLAPALLGIGLLTTYTLTLHPGVTEGDSAELQYMCPQFGVCHPPGYRIEVVCGKLFSLLPIGPDIAWRINWMMAVAGTVGCLALFGAVRRITGQALPALLAALTLAFSSVYWHFCRLAEAYVFYNAFLLLGTYATVRFVLGNRPAWLYAGALAVGVAVAERISELPVVPALLGLWFCRWRHARVSVGRVALAGLLFALPFVATVGLHLLRYDPSQLYLRDSLLSDRLLGRAVEQPADAANRLRAAATYSLGLKWTHMAGFRPRATWRELRQYARLLSGAGAFDNRTLLSFAEDKDNQFPGTCISLAGLLLAAWGVGVWRREPAWVVLGLGMFLGNLAFYLWHHPWDNLTFTIPGLTGLALLVGLGAAGPRRPAALSRTRVAWQLGVLAVPAFLALTNYRVVMADAGHERERVRHYREHVVSAPFPPLSVIVTSYWQAMTFRYLLHLEAGRPDITVIDASIRRWAEIADHFARRGRPTFLPADRLKIPAMKEAMTRETPPELAAAGFVQVHPGRLAPVGLPP